MLGIVLRLLPLCVSSPGFVDTSTDQLAVLRHESFDSKARASLVVGLNFGPSTGGGANGGSAVDPPSLGPSSFGFDDSFFRYAGATPVRVAFSADLDGDLSDEIVVLRESVAGGRYSLSVHRAPVGSQNVSHPTLRTAKDAIGSKPTFGAIIAADGIDLDGDFRDEIVVVRQVESGSQRLEVYALPSPNANSKKTKTTAISKAELGAPFASYLDLGSDPKDAIVDLAAVDMDGDGKEEIALLRRTLDGAQSIEVIPAPRIVADLPPITFGTLALPASTGPVLELEATDVDGDGIDEVMIRTHVDLDGPLDDGSTGDPNGMLFPPPMTGLSRIDILPLPTGGTIVPGMAPAEPIFLSDAFDSVLDEVIVLRGPNPKPGIVSAPLDELLNASFDGSLSHQVVTGDYLGNSSVVTVGPFQSASGKFDGEKFTLDIPGAATSFGGILNTGTGAIDLASGNLGDNGSLELPIPGTTSTLQATFDSLRVVTYGNHVLVQGTYSGVVVSADGKSKSIANGQLAFTRD